ncbi:uncharacterized protein [Argopecten irradians]|uniref:uncharacterized protein n=1 Tax=Argopecten irradians TaxID=31199 RepID=UPI00371FE3D0
MFGCIECQKRCPTMRALNQHVRDKHGEKKRCPHEGCEYTYPKSRSSYLQSHMHRMHRVLRTPGRTEVSTYVPKVASVVKVVNPPQSPLMSPAPSVYGLYGYCTPLYSPERIELDEPLFPEPPRKIHKGDDTILPAGQEEERGFESATLPAGQEDVKEPAAATLPASQEEAEPEAATLPASQEEAEPTVATLPASQEEAEPTVATLPASQEEAEPEAATLPASQEEAEPTVATLPASQEEAEPEAATLPASQEEAEPTIATLPASQEEAEPEAATLPAGQEEEKGSLDDLKERATQLLKMGGMPAFPPAPRLWNDVEDEEVTVAPGLLWPPKDWRISSADHKLLMWETAAVQLCGVSAGRQTILGRTQFLCLPGGLSPRMEDGEREVVLARYFNYMAIRKVAETGQDSAGLIPIMEKLLRYSELDSCIKAVEEVEMDLFKKKGNKV